MLHSWLHVRKQIEYKKACVSISEAVETGVEMERYDCKEEATVIFP